MYLSHYHFLSGSTQFILTSEESLKTLTNVSNSTVQNHTGPKPWLGADDKICRCNKAVMRKFVIRLTQAGSFYS